MTITNDDPSTDPGISTLTLTVDGFTPSMLDQCREHCHDMFIQIASLEFFSVDIVISQSCTPMQYVAYQLMQVDLIPRSMHL